MGYKICGNGVAITSLFLEWVVLFITHIDELSGDEFDHHRIVWFAPQSSSIHSVSLSSYAHRGVWTLVNHELDRSISVCAPYDRVDVVTHWLVFALSQCLDDK